VTSCPSSSLAAAVRESPDHGGIIAEVALILLIVYTAGGNALFGTAPIEYRVWLFVLPFALSMLMLEEGRKVIVRWREGRTIASAGSRSMGAETMAGRS
jgi:hypothetical protein